MIFQSKLLNDVYVFERLQDPETSHFCWQKWFQLKFQLNDCDIIYLLIAYNYIGDMGYIFETFLQCKYNGPDKDSHTVKVRAIHTRKVHLNYHYQ